MSALAGGRTTLSPTTQTTDKRMGPARLEWCTNCAAVDWIIPAETHIDLEREWLRLDGLADRIGTQEARQDAERARWAYRAAIESAPTHAGCGGRIERHRFTTAERERIGQMMAAEERISSRTALQLRSRWLAEIGRGNYAPETPSRGGVDHAS